MTFLAKLPPVAKLLADTQDAYGELQERLHEVGALLRDCQARLQAATPQPSEPDRPAEETP